MLTFGGLLGRQPFLVAVLVRIALFAASVLAFPLVLQAVAAATNCRSVGGACGAVGLVVAMAYKPLAAAVFIFSLAGVSVRRARDAGCALLGLLIPAALAADYQTLVVFGAPWSLAFSTGVLFLKPPYCVLAALIGLAVLASAPPRRSSGGSDGWSVDLDLEPPSRTILLIALGLALLVCLIGLNGQVLTLLVGSVTILLPTFCIVLALVWAVTNLAVRPSRLGSLVLLLALLPYLHWAYAHWESRRQRSLELDEIAAVPTARISKVPGTLVFESRSSTGIRAAWSVPELGEVIAKGSYGSSLVAFDRPTGRKSAAPRQIGSLPGSYLLLKAGRESGFAKRGQIYAADGGPLELRVVDGSRDELVGIWYRAFRPGPVRVPVLTSAGWFRGSNSASTDQVEAAVAQFLKGSLPPSRSASLIGARGP